MAHPRKKRRTQRAGATQNATAAGITKTNAADRTPKSMVIRMGASDVGPSVTQLVKDMRDVMEPHTAARLKERRSNRLRDYTTMAGPLGVTHFMLFSRSAAGNTNLRIAITPRGPTLSFRVEKYSLCKDIAKAQRRPKSGGGGVEHLTPPLLVMNNFTTPSTSTTDPKASIPKHLENLTTSVFQSLFPAISPQRTPLSSIRRVLLLNREFPSSSKATSEGTYTLSLRHYAITTKPLVSLSRGLKRLRTAEQFAISRSRKAQPTNGLSGKRVKGALPNMSRLDDVADYLLDPSAAGFTSASESEVDTDAEVEVLEGTARKVLNRRDKQRQREEQRAANAAGPSGEGSPAAEARTHRPGAQKRAVRLTELGPRMTLRLVKVEEGLCDGKVMWHEFVTKSKAEERDMEAVWDKRKKEKEERKNVQRENLEKKRKEKAGKKGDGGEGKDDEDDEEQGEDWDDYDDDLEPDEEMEEEEEEEMEVDEGGAGDDADDIEE